MERHDWTVYLHAVRYARGNRRPKGSECAFFHAIGTRPPNAATPAPNACRTRAQRRGDVRRAKLYYLRDKVGKAAKIKEKSFR